MEKLGVQLNYGMLILNNSNTNLSLGPDKDFHVYCQLVIGSVAFSSDGKSIASGLSGRYELIRGIWNGDTQRFGFGMLKLANFKFSAGWTTEVW